jgi:hypothetical protein
MKDRRREREERSMKNDKFVITWPVLGREGEAQRALLLEGAIPFGTGQAVSPGNRSAEERN